MLIEHATAKFYLFNYYFYAKVDCVPLLTRKRKIYIVSKLKLKKFFYH